MVQGRNLILALNNTAIAAAKSCSFKIQQNFIEACSPTSGRTKKKIPTDYSWDLSCDCLMATPAYADSIIDMAKNGTMVTIQFYDLTLGLYRYGNAYVANATIDGSVGSLSKLSISLTGSEELNKLNWNDIPFDIWGGYSVDEYETQSYDKWFRYSRAGLRGLYVAIKQNNQYIRIDDGRTGDELSNSIDDDAYIREAHFKGGHGTIYLVTGTLNGNVITRTMDCEIEIPLIANYPNTWFKVQCSAIWEDEPLDPHEQSDEIVKVYNLKFMRAE